MSLRVLLAAAPLVSLFSFPAFVAAAVNVTANCTLPSYFWTFNSFGQSPCIVAGNMLATCFQADFTLSPLAPGYAYSGPWHDYANKCQCSTVGFSLISACVTCQNRDPFSWSVYTSNCTSVLEPPGQFPNPVPAGIYVPHWATLDVTNKNYWDANDSIASGDTPEYGPGAIFGPTGVYTSGVSASSTSTPTSTSATPSSTSAAPSHTASPKGSSSNGGAIAGGIVGGLAIVSIATAVIFYLRRHSRASSARSTIFDSFRPHMDGFSGPMSDRGTVEPSSPSTPYTQEVMREQTTFQGYAGVHSVDTPPVPGSPSTYVGSGSNLSHLHTSPPQTKGYRGLPMPSV